MIPLRDLQLLFRNAVLGPGDGSLRAHVRSSGSIADRIAVYRNTVQGSLVEALAAAFPATQRIVGDAFFASLARRFIANAPPRRPQLSTYGSDFPAFIAISDVHQQLPYLADVARLEWVRGEAYFAADAPPFDAAFLVAASDDIETLRLDPHPAVRLIRSQFPIYRIWEVNQPDIIDIPRVDMKVGEDVLVSRPRDHVITRLITSADAVFVEAVYAGKRLGEAAEAALTYNAAHDLQNALAQHFVKGTFRDMRRAT